MSGFFYCSNLVANLAMLQTWPSPTGFQTAAVQKTGADACFFNNKKARINRAFLLLRSLAYM
jgi:hypothetical protein